MRRSRFLQAEISLLAMSPERSGSVSDREKRFVAGGAVLGYVHPKEAKENMRGNRVKEKLNKGEVAIAVGGHSNTGDTIDFLGPLGFDGIWLEGEHGSVSWGGIGDLSRACDLWGMASVARLHQNDPGVITRVLDLGVNGIVVPHVSSRAEAERGGGVGLFRAGGKAGHLLGQEILRRLRLS